MRSVEAREAKSNLPDLLEEVERGGSVLITRQGMVIAKIIPAVADRDVRDVNQAIAALRSFSRQRARTLQGLDLREMIEEGRR